MAQVTKYCTESAGVLPPHPDQLGPELTPVRRTDPLPPENCDNSPDPPAPSHNPVGNVFPARGSLCSHRFIPASRSHSQIIAVGPRQITGWFIQIVPGIDVFLHDLSFRSSRLKVQRREGPTVVSHIPRVPHPRAACPPAPVGPTGWYAAQPAGPRAWPRGYPSAL